MMSATFAPPDLHLADAMDRGRPVPAWVLSAALHAATLIALILLVDGRPRKSPGELVREGGIVLTQRADGQREYFDGADDQQSATASEAAAPTPSATPLPAESLNPADLAGLLPTAGPLTGAADIGGGLPKAGDLTVGSTPNKSFGAGQTQTEVFGAQGTGSKFIYVFDRSGSMSGHGGSPIRAAKAELAASLDDLEKIHQFQVIFYNERPQVFSPTGGTPQLMWGDKRGKDLAKSFIRGIVATGSTRHMEALRIALAMRPDVIFFLTDADEPRLNDDDLARVRRLNRAGGSVINAIEFGYGPQADVNNFLVRLARQNDGQHVYVDISKLP